MQFSLASNNTGLREPLGGKDAGKLDYGKHAKHNMGVSILRADRELELEDKFLPSRDPRHRWWGAEVSFGPGLDAIMGVTNNKQQAEHLSSVSNNSWSDFAEDGEKSEIEIKKRLQEEDPAEFIRLDVSTTPGIIKEMASIIEANNTVALNKSDRQDSPVTGAQEQRGNWRSIRGRSRWTSKPCCRARAHRAVGSVRC